LSVNCCGQEQSVEDGSDLESVMALGLK
jgi:hypothetical protein